MAVMVRGYFSPANAETASASVIAIAAIRFFIVPRVLLLILAVRTLGKCILGDISLASSSTLTSSGIPNCIPASLCFQRFWCVSAVIGVVFALLFCRPLFLNALSYGGDLVTLIPTSIT